MEQLRNLRTLLQEVGGFYRFINDAEFVSDRQLFEQELRHMALGNAITDSIYNNYIWVAFVLLQHMMIKIESLDEPQSIVVIGESEVYQSYYAPNDYIIAHTPGNANCRTVLLQCLKLFYMLGYPELVKTIHNKLVMYMQQDEKRSLMCPQVVTFSAWIGTYLTEPPIFEHPLLRIKHDTLEYVPETFYIKIKQRNVICQYGCCNCGLLPVTYNDGVELSYVCCKPDNAKCAFRIKLQ